MWRIVMFTLTKGDSITSDVFFFPDLFVDKTLADAAAKELMTVTGPELTVVAAPFKVQ